MKRYFLLIFCAYAVINFCYKSYFYCISEKINGRVVSEEKYVTKYKKGNGRVSYEESIAPTISYMFDGFNYEESKGKWGYINLLDINDEVTVLVSDKGKRVEINTLFQFWFTFFDMIYAFILCFVGTIIWANLFPEKKEKIREWK